MLFLRGLHAAPFLMHATAQPSWSYGQSHCKAYTISCRNSVPYIEGTELVLQGDIQKALSLSPEDALAAKAIFGLEPKVST